MTVNNKKEEQEEVEMVGLMAAEEQAEEGGRQMESSSTSGRKHSMTRGQRLLLIALVASVGTVLIILAATGTIGGGGGASAFKTSTSAAQRRASSPPLTSAKFMLQQLEASRQNWIDNQLKVDYGEEGYQNIFEPFTDSGERMNVGKHRAFVDPNRLPRRNQGANYDEINKNSHGPAWDRMVRKWMIKLLQLQLRMLEQHEEELEENMILDQDPENEQDDEDFVVSSTSRTHDQEGASIYGTFVWANGGHSASAGHGNFHRESYTAVLGRDMQRTLREIGLDFQVRNYAMGGTASGEEVALCFSSIFGKDIDAITWDYGMTDGNDFHNIILYLYNAARIALIDDTNSVTQPGNIPHRPSLTVLHSGGDYQTELLQTIQGLGMPMLVMDDRFQKDHMYPGFPDMFGMTDAQINATPPFMRYFKCNDMIEAGDPGCADNKFNMTKCQVRSGLNTWHPGWRYHALVGHTLSMTIVELIMEALRLMITSEPPEETPQARHNRLMTQLQAVNLHEHNDYEHIFEQPIPPELKMPFEENFWKGDLREDNKAAMKDLGMIEKLVQDFPFCHTALLPAEMRYRGYLTENFNQTGTILDEQYEHGILLSKLIEAEKPSEEEGRVSFSFMNPHAGRERDMVIGTTDSEYDDCDELTQQDHLDYFFISSQQGWRTVTFPNDAQQAYYTEFNTDNIKGWVFYCLTDCPWGNCDTGDIRSSLVDGSFDANEFGRIEMKVNDVEVSDAKCFKKCCALLHPHPDPEEQFRWTPNQEGKFVFQSRITSATQYSYARFSSFIVA